MQEFNAAIDRVQELFRMGYLDSAREAIGEYIRPALENAILQPHRIPAQTRLVHYTTIDVVHSILQRLLAGDSVSLRAYDTVHVNDPTEGRRLLGLLPCNDPWLDDTIDCTNQRSHAYVTSFILDDGEMADDLVFWRTYGKEGEGCSISFSIGETSANLYRVLYTDAEAKSTVELIKTAMNKLRLRLMNQTGEEPLSTMIRHVINRVRYLYKAEAYKNEKECRFVLVLDDATNSAEFEYTESHHRSPIIRHYVEHGDLDVNRVFVTNTQIMLGPTLALRENVRYCIEHALKRANLVGPRVGLSGLPYQRI